MENYNKFGLIMILFLILNPKIQSQGNNKSKITNINDIGIDSTENNIFLLSNSKEIEIETDKLKIACAYATDNAYTYPTLVAMTSLVENVGNKTFYEIYIMINSEFTGENKRVLKSVEENHKEKCEIIFLNTGNTFKNLKTNRLITTPAYYKLI